MSLTNAFISTKFLPFKSLKLINLYGFAAIKYFKDNKNVLISHQLNSFNDFIKFSSIKLDV